jgi:hypothetical protein
VQWQTTVIIGGPMASRHTAPHLHTIAAIFPSLGSTLRPNYVLVDVVADKRQDRKLSFTEFAKADGRRMIKRRLMASPRRRSGQSQSETRRASRTSGFYCAQ